MTKKVILGIYKITNVKNGKFYIGSSRDINKRWKEHTHHLKRGDHINKHLQNAWNKYGAKSFHFEIIDVVENMEELVELEQTYMDLLTPWEQDIGYNIAKYTDNSFRGMTHDERVRKIISETNTGRFTGEKSSTAKLTWEDVHKIRELYKTKTCKQIHELFPIIHYSGIKYIVKNKTWYDENYQPPVKTREFLEARRIANQTWKKYPVIMLNKDTGEFLREFSSIAEAARFLNLKANSDISLVCKGERITAYGYKWKYKSEYQQTS